MVAVSLEEKREKMGERDDPEKEKAPFTVGDHFRY